MFKFSRHASSDHSAFTIAFTVFAIGTPLALVTYAFGTIDDSFERAQMVVQGCMTIAAILLGGVALRVSYSYGLDHARELANSMTRHVSH
jgi:hypothetical protein